MGLKSALMLVVFLVLCLAAGWIGSAAGAANIDTWYRTLNKPSWTPPSWVFAPVWTGLYILMGVAAWLVWRARRVQPVGAALTLFGIQLVLNALWSIIFFGWKMPGAAVLEIVTLWAAIVATLMLFWKIRITAGLLLLPYLAWVSFAAVLNVAIWRLNVE